MNITGWFLLAVGVGVLVANGAFLLGRHWGFETGRRTGLRELERRLRAREAYLEQRLSEYAGMLASALHENERHAAEMQDSADWWKNGGLPPGER
jgi:hypothetical protein